MADNHYIRDQGSRVIINNNQNELDQYMAQRDRIQKEAGLQNQINKLETDMSEIKSMLQLILNK